MVGICKSPSRNSRSARAASNCSDVDAGSVIRKKLHEAKTRKIGTRNSPDQRHVWNRPIG
jgi:hypothetical protein